MTDCEDAIISLVRAMLCAFISMLGILHGLRLAGSNLMKHNTKHAIGTSTRRPIKQDQPEVNYRVSYYCVRAVHIPQTRIY